MANPYGLARLLDKASIQPMAIVQEKPVCIGLIVDSEFYQISPKIMDFCKLCHKNIVQICTRYTY